MMYRVRIIIGVAMVLLGIIHICFVFPIGKFDQYHLWFIGSGIAIILSGLINILAVLNRRMPYIKNLILGINSVFLILFLVGLMVLCGPQVYVGIGLYLLGTLLPILQHYRKKTESGEYKHFEEGAGLESKEILSETSVTPMLRIFDRKKAEEFYINWLGFKIEWEHRFDDTAPVYMEVSKAGIKLHLTEHHGDCSPGGKVYIVCKGLREYHKQLIDKNYPYNRPGLESAIWGSPCMTVIDPFGNQLLFTESNDSGGDS